MILTHAEKLAVAKQLGKIEICKSHFMGSDNPLTIREIVSDAFDQIPGALDSSGHDDTFEAADETMVLIVEMFLKEIKSI